MPINFFKSKKSGFTIVEILIVITVIGILVGIVAVAYPGYQERARDTKRKSDLHTIASAYRAALSDGKIESISYDNIRWIFPNSSPSPSSPTFAGNDSFPGGPGGYLGQLGYLKETLIDPKWINLPTGAPPGDITYSGYIVIQCWNPNQGFYAIARLEKPSNEDVANFNTFLNSQINGVNGIPFNGVSPSDTNSCFYSPQGDNAKEVEDRNSSSNTSARQIVKYVLMNSDNGYNYVVNIK